LSFVVTYENNSQENHRSGVGSFNNSEAFQLNTTKNGDAGNNRNVQAYENDAKKC
jgi:hypothetical protein